MRLPLTIASLTRDYAIRKITLGCSGTDVFRLEAPGAPPLFLKTGAGLLREEVAAEAERLHWLAGRIPAPEPLAFDEVDETAYLLMSAVPGIDATDRDVPAMVRELAAGLRLIHSVPLDDCPFDHRIEAMLERARRRLELGLVDPDEFDSERHGRSPADVFAELLALPDPAGDPVLTHGDYCLPNVLIDDGRLAGFCDLGRLGAGDRYRDLALAARSLAHNWGAEHVPLLFEAYGLAKPDQDTIAYYHLLDEFF
jgi:kanamycin kinase/aminoglycoside 3'-phosphotransferase-2